MRLLFLIFLLANAAAFGYIRYAEKRSGSDAQIALLQISADKVKLLKPNSSRPPERKAQAQPALVCLEWGGFSAEDSTRAAAAIAKLDFGDKVTQRTTGDGFWVYVPPLKTKADADKKAGEVRALGVTDLYVVQDLGPWRFAISLGMFRTEDAANNYLAQLKQKGVRSAVAGPRGAVSNVFVIRDPGDAGAAKLAELKTEFPAATLKAAACADAQTAKN
jgi:hypothetical protein